MHCQKIEMRFGLIILLSLGLLSCTDFNAEEMFASHATQTSIGEVEHLRAGKVECMHCPMYFAFDATPSLVERVISVHKLKQVDSLPPVAEEVERLVQRGASWWQVANPKAQDKIYWVHYSSKSGASEPAFRLLVLKNGQAFFITSGRFSSEYYVRDNA